MSDVICNVCNEHKSLDRNNFRRTSKDVYHVTCRLCEDRLKSEKHINKDGNLWCCICDKYLPLDNFNKSAHNNEYRLGKDVRCKSCRTKQSANSRNSKLGDSRISRVIKERILNAKLRSNKKNVEFTITEDYVQELLEKQNGKCALSGIAMTFILGEGRVPTNISIDRKDTDLGYTKENIQLVCMAVNQMKSDMTETQLIEFCKSIVNYQLIKHDK